MGLQNGVLNAKDADSEVLIKLLFLGIALLVSCFLTSHATQNPLLDLFFKTVQSAMDASHYF